MKFVGDPNYGALFYLILFIPGLAFILGVFFVLGSWVGLAAVLFTPILVFFYCKAMNHGVFSLVEVSGGDIKFSSVDFITNKEKLKVCKVSNLTSVREKRYLFSLGLVLVFENHSNVFIKIETYRKSG